MPASSIFCAKSPKSKSWVNIENFDLKKIQGPHNRGVIMGPLYFFQVKILNIYPTFGILAILGQNHQKGGVCQNCHNPKSIGNFGLKKIQGSHNYGGIMGPLYFLFSKILNIYPSFRNGRNGCKPKRPQTKTMLLTAVEGEVGSNPGAVNSQKYPSAWW